MFYYGVANGRTIGVYDNWEDCRRQVHGYPGNDYRKFKTPDAAWDYIDEYSSSGRRFKQEFSNHNAIAYRNNNNNNQVALRKNSKETKAYQRTDYMEGRNVTMMRERTYRSGQSGNGYYVEQYVRTYWENRK